MGYTRYWARTNKKIDQEFVDAVIKIIEDCKEKGITIRDGWGTGLPVVTIDMIDINGANLSEKGGKDLSHENLVIDNSDYRLGNFCFCKTARKPYDYAVREILKVADEMGIVTDVSSDGENERIISDEEY